MTALEREPITATDSERLVLGRIQGVLGNVNRVPKLISPNGEEIELPESLFHVLRQLVYHLAQGRAVTIVQLNKALTPQKAAAIHNISRPYPIHPLQHAQIPFTY